MLTRKDFMGNHEWCFYCWKEGSAHVYLGPNNATDVWQVKKIAPQQMEHLTAKPAELAVLALQYSSRVGENVLDLFGGSGSILEDLPNRFEVCYEASCGYGHYHDLLRPVASRVLVAHPGQLRLI